MRDKQRLLGRLLMLVVLAMAFAACGDDESADTTAPATEATTATEDTIEAPMDGRCGDPDRLGDSLNMYNWADYIDTVALDMFEEECGVAVTLDTYTSNEENLAKIQAGNSGYSLTIPTDYMAEIMIQEDLALELDYSLLPNADDVDPNQLGWYYDPDNTYTLPYQYSTTGLAYNVTAFDTPPTSWSVLFDENEHCGQSSILDDQNEAPGAALAYLGYSWNSADRAENEEALDVLLEARECVSAFDSANFIGNLASGEVVLAEAWGFGAGIARLDNPDVAYVIPDEGGLLWQDNFLIPADAPDPYTAHVLINYLMEPDIGAIITEWTLGFTPMLSVEPLLSDFYHEIITDGGIGIDDDVRDRLELSLHPAQELKAEIWRAVQGG